jgi:hypothetical protein
MELTLGGSNAILTLFNQEHLNPHMKLLQYLTVGTKVRVGSGSGLFTVTEHYQYQARILILGVVDGSKRVELLASCLEDGTPDPHTMRQTQNGFTGVMEFEWVKPTKVTSITLEAPDSRHEDLTGA